MKTRKKRMHTYLVKRIDELPKPIIRPAPPPEGAIGVFTHKEKGGKYILMYIGMMQAKSWFKNVLGRSGIINQQTVDDELVAVYIGEDGKVWVRPIKEFAERFSEIIIQ